VASKIKEVGWRGKPFSMVIPFECRGIISDCATALGVSFSVFYQLGVARALSFNNHDLYVSWAKSIVQPLFDEMMSRAKKRSKAFREIENDLTFRLSDPD
jgi:hypothetical protein